MDNHSNKDEGLDALAGFLGSSLNGLIFFQYALWMTFLIDVPWYIDLAAGWFLIRKLNTMWWMIAVILHYSGFAYPLYESVRTALHM